MPLEQVGQFEVSALRILDEQGRADSALDPQLSAEQRRELYGWMVLAREADQRMLRLQRQGRMGTFPLSTGQEAAACASAYAMDDDDWFVGSYRELGARLLRGEPLLDQYRYWNGWEEGNRGDARRRVLPVAAIIGSQVPHAVGVAYAAKLRGERAAVVTYFGDGATSEGDVHEAMNFAAVWQVPLVFFCINNQWAISQPRGAQTRAETIAQKAVAYGFEGIQVDGNDALAVYRATEAALRRARDGGGPTLIEAVTYRLMMHTTADDPRRYREEDDVERWWQRDPLPRFRRHLERIGAWDDEQQRQLEARTKQQIDATVARFEAEVHFAPDAPFDHVLGTRHAALDEQRAAFFAELERRRGDG